MPETLCDIGVSINEVLRLLNKYFSTNTALKSHEAKIIGEAHGFSSAVMRIELKWNCESDLESR